MLLVALVWGPWFWLMHVVGKQLETTPPKVGFEHDDLIGGLRGRSMNAHPDGGSHDYDIHDMVFDSHDDGGGE